jgi:hypothetical protein
MKFFRTPTTFMFVALSFCVLSLSGCLTTYDEMLGSGPLTLTKNTEIKFQEYKSRNPMVFAISENGFYSQYLYCPEAKCVPSSNVMYRAIKACEEIAYGQSCKIFAINDTIVWKGFDRPIGENIPTDMSDLKLVKEPIKLQKPQEVALKEYNKSLLQNPDLRGGFAISTNGAFGWMTYYKNTKNAEIISAIDAVLICEENAKSTCLLLAKDRLLTYNDLSVDTYFSQRETRLADARADVRTEREIEVEWAKFPGKIHGTVNLNSGKVHIRSDTGLECAGTELRQTSQTTGFWTIKCDDGTVAQGSYRALGPGKGSIGLGIDGEGNELRYVIAPID